MKLFDILDDISDFCITNSHLSLYRINYGGCGIFALRLYKFLDKIGIKSKIHLVNEIQCSQDMLFSHILIEFSYNDKCYYYDADGLKESLDKYYLVNEINVESLIKMVKDENFWSSTYNRKHISLLGKKINEIYVNEFMNKQFVLK